MKYARLLLIALLICACSKNPPAEPEPSSAKPAPTASSPTPSTPLVLAQGVRFVKAETGDDVAKLVRVEREAVRKDGRDLIVYVGAKWCEPCQRFHAAAQRGELDNEFPQLSILEFDADEDRERLVTANYSSRLIPLFVYPAEDGRASDRRFEGGIKGDGAVSNITPRLHTLLGK